jgi:hypothetical protein
VQISSRRVAAPRADSSRLVRPEEFVPQTSVRHPRGSPPVKASNCAIPLEAVSGAERISRHEAGITPANFGIPESCCLRTADLCSVTKGEEWPMASRCAGEDIKILDHRDQEESPYPWAKTKGGVFRFLFAYKILLSGS